LELTDTKINKPIWFLKFIPTRIEMQRLIRRALILQKEKALE
jgi:hypothetical protein